jgi:hypothetical protein
MQMSSISILSKLLLASALLVVTATASASEPASEEEICVKYEKEYGWSKGYSVTGHLISGSDLNQKTGSLSRFKPFSTYVAVFWEKDEVSLFELPSSSMGSVPIFATEVKDQKGRKWKIQQGNGFCL